MSHEFSPKAPAKIPTESRVKSPNTIQVSGALSRYLEMADQKYTEAMVIAERIDDRIETAIPFNKNAVYAASLLMLAAVRGAQIS